MSNELNLDAPGEHVECREWMKRRFAELGADITVSTSPPLVKTPYDQTPFICPHGVTYYHAPTSEQIAQWARDGVA